ncbi:MAG: sugar phosphate isomerase/epimerase [Firmicutes bacterium]|nr:sugar phosphate isomerase/epimerase [Bacillota bacterium]
MSLLQTLDASMLGIKCPVEELIPLAAAKGFQAICPGMDLLEDPDRLAKADILRKEAGLAWGLLPMPADFYFWGLEDEGFEKGLEKLRRFAELGQKYGIRHAYNHVWSTSFREFDVNFDWHVKRVKAVSELLASYGIRYGLEFLGPHEIRTWQPLEFVHSMAGVLSIADAAGGIAGIAFDCYHWYTSGGKEKDVRMIELMPNRLVCVHLNDAPAGVAVEDQKDMQRCLPMTTGVIDSRQILQRLDRVAPDGLFMIEPFEPERTRFGKMSASEAACEAAAAMERVK